MNEQIDKLTIVGSGIVGALEAYYAYLAARKAGTKLRVTIYEKYHDLSHTTSANVMPSLTSDEILSVVPRGSELVKKLQYLFSEPGGIRVDDVPNVNNTTAAKNFISAVENCGADEEEYQRRTQALLKLGKFSMQLWQQIYRDADPELQHILRESNFHPSYDPKNDRDLLNSGYRIGLLYNIPAAQQQAQSIHELYSAMGYKYCKILTPDKVQSMDPTLTEFCRQHSTFANGARVWKDNAAAILQPGGCIDTGVFLPKFHKYLQKIMWFYTNEKGVKKHCFKLKYDRDVKGVELKNLSINGLRFANGITKYNKYPYQLSEYVFCPGFAVGTLAGLGFIEPEYAGFAGAALRLRIPISNDKAQIYANFNQRLTLHQEGVVLAWQARAINDHIFIGVGGTKAFYADQPPTINQDFAKNRNLLQLNIINDVLPQFVSMALGRDTYGKELMQSDLDELVKTGIAHRWVGARAVAYDGFPTLGPLYINDGNDFLKVHNARCTTHLGSGGISFGPAAVLFSRHANELHNNAINDELALQITEFASSNRSKKLAVKPGMISKL